MEKKIFSSEKHSTDGRAVERGKCKLGANYTQLGLQTSKAGLSSINIWWLEVELKSEINSIGSNWIRSGGSEAASSASSFVVVCRNRRRFAGKGGRRLLASSSALGLVFVVDRHFG
nr:hypothetical protein Iba_chr12dCG11550 [Ipomoea batatas]